MARQSLTDVSLLNKGLKEVKESARDYLGKELSRPGNSRCKGPEVETYLVYFTKSQEASVAGAK